MNQQQQVPTQVLDSSLSNDSPLRQGDKAATEPRLGEQSKGKNWKKGQRPSRCTYDSISTEARRALYRLTQEQGVSIRKACRMLEIKYSTGKTLMQLYRKTGRIDRIKQQRESPIVDKDVKDKSLRRVVV